MSLRTAGRQSPIILTLIILFGAWITVTVFRVYDVMESVWIIGSFEKEVRSIDLIGKFVGQIPLSGFIGLLVMLAVLGMLIALYGALSEESPTPDRFPPEREESRRTEP